jgi:hypothetical protein
MRVTKACDAGREKSGDFSHLEVDEEPGGGDASSPPVLVEKFAILLRGKAAPGVGAQVAELLQPPLGNLPVGVRATKVLRGEARRFGQ